MFFGQECTKVIVGIDWGQPSPFWKKKNCWYYWIDAKKSNINAY